MNKYQEAIKLLNKYRNSYYNSVDKEQVETANALDVVLPTISREHTLLELYRLLISLKEEYQVNDNILKKQNLLYDIKNVEEEINLLEEELELAKKLDIDI